MARHTRFRFSDDDPRVEIRSESGAVVIAKIVLLVLIAVAVLRIAFLISVMAGYSW